MRIFKLIKIDGLADFYLFLMFQVPPGLESWSRLPPFSGNSSSSSRRSIFRSLVTCRSDETALLGWVILEINMFCGFLYWD